MKKMSILVIAMAMILSVLCSCANVEYRIDIQKDNKIHMEASLLVDGELYKQLDQTKMEVYRQQLKSSGFTVSYHTQEAQEGLLATIDLDSLEELTQNSTNIIPLQTISYGNSGLFFFTKQAIQLNVDMSNFVPSLKLVPEATTSEPETSETEEDQEAENDAESETESSELTEEEVEKLANEKAVQEKLKNLSSEDLQMKLTITMPQKTTAEGAEISNQDRSVTWNIQTNGMNELRLETTQIDWLALILSLVLLALFATLGLVMLVQYRKGRQQPCKTCGSKNFYKRAVCRRCGNKFPLQRRKVVHNQFLLCLTAVFLAGTLGLFLLIGAGYAALSTVPMTEMKGNHVQLVDLINQIAVTNQIVDPNQISAIPAAAESQPESSTSETASEDSREEESTEEGSTEEKNSSEEETSSGSTEMTAKQKIEILVEVAKKQEEALAKYSTDDYWDARSYLGEAFETAQVMQGLYQSDETIIDEMYEQYVQAGIIDRDGNILSLLMGYKPSAQKEPISENQAVKNAKKYLESMSFEVPENAEISDQDDATYTVHFYNGTESEPSTESWYQVDKYTGEVLSDY